MSAGQVYAIGFGMLAAGMALLAWVGYGFEPFTQWRPVLAGVALAAAIVFYNWHHKDNPLSPLVMGVCRLLVYVAAAFCRGGRVCRDRVYRRRVVLLCYLIGLTYAAKQEHLGTPGEPLAAGVSGGAGDLRSLPLPLRSRWSWLPLLLFAGWTLYALMACCAGAPKAMCRAPWSA